MRKYRKWMQIGILSAVIVIGAFTLYDSISGKVDIPKIGSKAPEFTLPGVDGAAVRLSDYAGKPIVLNFWGTYCEPCVREMPLIQEYYEKYEDDGVVVLGVNEGDSLVSIKAFTRQYKLTFPILLDNDTVRKQYGVTAYPATFFIDTSGTIVEMMPGEMSEAHMKSALAKLGKS